MAEATAQGTLLSAEMIAKLERMELVSRKIFRGRMKGKGEASAKVRV